MIHLLSDHNDSVLILDTLGIRAHWFRVHFEKMCLNVSWSGRIALLFEPVFSKTLKSTRPVNNTVHILLILLSIVKTML